MQIFLSYFVVLAFIQSALLSSAALSADKGDRCRPALTPEIDQVWADYVSLLERSRKRTFSSSSESQAVVVPAFNRTSWMYPNERTPRLPEDSVTTETYTPITFDEHLENLRIIESKIQNSDYGMFGPHSLMWKVVGVASDFLNFGAVNYLQLAHPVGVQGVYDHPGLLTNPIDRMKNTARYIYEIIYGPWDEVKRLSVGLYKGHSKVTGTLPETLGAFIQGQSYSALSPEALMWVYATRFISWLDGYNILSARPLDDFEREQVYQESKLFAVVFGIPLHVLPRTFSDFYSYYQSMLYGDHLAVGNTARIVQSHFRKKAEAIITTVVGASLLTANIFSIAPSIMMYSAIKSGFENSSAFYMPHHLSSSYGFNFSQSASHRNAKLTYGILKSFIEPNGLTVLPAYEIALARVNNRRVSSRTLNRHYLITGEFK